MSNVERVNQFLLDVLNAKSAQHINSNDIYHMLCFNDVDFYDYSADSVVNGNFDRWCSKYGRYDGKNIEVFVDPNWSYFCQFINRGREVMANDDQIKVYIPLDNGHLTKGVEQIFDFLEENNIAHMSKVSRKIRFDDVVVRLGSLEDADKLHNFLKSNTYIQDGLIKSNPFAVSRDGIAYVSDRRISYNTAVSDFINLYVDDVLLKEDYTDFGINGFRNFILNYYNEVIINHDNVDRFNNDFEFADRTDSYNFVRVAELLYNSLDPSFTYDDYMEHFSKNVTDYYRKPELAYDYSDDYESFIEETQELTDSQSVDTDKKIYDLIKKSLIEFGKKTLPDGSRKYSNNDVINQLYEYLDTGDLIYITSSGNLRQDFARNDFRNMLASYLRGNNISFGDVLLETKKQILEESLITNYVKYGDSRDLSFSIIYLLDNGSYDGFTRTNGARENMTAAVDVKDISNIVLREMNYPPNINLACFSREDRNQIIEQYVSSVKEKYHVGIYGGK